VHRQISSEFVISGDPKFVNAALKFAYGAGSPALKDDRIAGAQALSGTGALRIGFEFLRRFAGKDVKVYVPSPTWPNHCNIIRVRVWVAHSISVCFVVL
jgi:aspartate aminotransferase, mitochondrial